MSQLDPKIGPNFFLIGTAKGGTTFLSGLLDQHNEIFISKPKEPAFFARQWPRGWDWYATYFNGASGFKMRGDASTHYSAIDTYPECLPRIKKYCPSAKIIYVVRDPLPRIATFWKTLVRASWLNPLPFEEAVRTESLYIDSAQYWKQYIAYGNQFGVENIKFFFFEDLIKDPLKVAVECAEFLGVSRYFDFDLQKPNKNAASKMRRPGSLLRVIKRNMKFLDKVYAALPTAAQGLIRHVLKDEIEPPTYGPEFRSWVLDRVRKDALTLLDYFGKPPDYWDLEE